MWARNFRNLSIITVTKDGAGFDTDIKQIDLDSSVPQDPDVKVEVYKHVGKKNIRNLSIITVTKNGAGFDIDIKQIDLDSSVPQDPDVKVEVYKRG